MKFFVFCLLSIMFLNISCYSPKDKWQLQTVSNIDQVFYHTYYQFSVTVKYGNELRVISLFDDRWVPPTLLYDIPDNIPQYVTYYECKKQSPNHSIGEQRFVTIHMHKNTKLQGGGWNNGKFGSGMTIDINQGNN